ncbi:MAG: hypothetical protein KDA89_22340 [Planctomycetaceae bacterium]|nr:hypothetical protein [Planctomycetaceae bacterium]
MTRRSEIVVADISLCVRLGQRLIEGGLILLIAGGGLMKSLFPQLRGQGLSSTLLMFLVPVWLILLTGYVLCSIGWIQHNSDMQRLHAFGPQSTQDGRPGTPLLRFALSFLCSLFMVVSLFVVDKNSSGIQYFAAYCMFAIAAFGLYLMTAYTEPSRPATTTFLSIFCGIPGLAVVPFLWPLLLMFEISAARNAPPGDRSVFFDRSAGNMQNMLMECRARFGEAPRRISLWDRLTWRKVATPVWLRRNPADELTRLYQNLETVFREGTVAWGYVIQANERLFEGGTEDHPGEIVLSHDSDTGVRELSVVARRLFELKGTHPPDRQLRPIADYLTDERIRVYGLDVPSEISRTRCLICTTMFVRHHLPAGRLCSSFLPVVVVRGDQTFAMPLPKAYWPPALIRLWCR